MLSEVVIPTVDDDPSSLPQCLVNVFSFLFFSLFPSPLAAILTRKNTHVNSNT